MQRLIKFSKQYIDENRHWLKLALNWFILSALIGMLAVFIKPDLLASILSVYTDKFGAAPALNTSLAMQIFIQNLVASAIGLFGGIVFGLGPVIVIGLNGFILGYIVTSVLVATGNIVITLLLVIGGILPHGIFEITAFIIAGALGLRLGVEWLKNVSAGHRLQILKKNLFRAILLVPILAIALFIAALIEVFVSGHIVDKF